MASPWRSIQDVPHPVAWSPQAQGWIYQNGALVPQEIQTTIEDYVRRLRSARVEASSSRPGPTYTGSTDEDIGDQFGRLNVGGDRSSSEGSKVGADDSDDAENDAREGAEEDGADDDEEDDDEEGGDEEDDEEADDNEAGDHEDDDEIPDDGRSKNPYHDYKFGRVIEIQRQPPPSQITAISSAAYGPGMRRFVVVQAPRPGTQVFVALPIKTYLSQGVSTPGIIKAHHTIIYSRPPPRVLATEQPCIRGPDGRLEEGMQAQSIRVRPYDDCQALDSMARLDYSDPQRFGIDRTDIILYGKVHDDHQGIMWTQFVNVQRSIRAPAMQNPAFTADRARSPSPVRPRYLTPRALGLEVAPRSKPESGSRIVAPTESGVLSTEQMLALWTSLHRQAQDLGISLGAMTTAQLSQLAANPQMRHTWLERLRARLPA